MTSVCRLLLIRHGQTEWNRRGWVQGHRDVPLNEEGWRQADALARAVACEPLAAVYSSDLRRARETAAPVAALHGVQVQTDIRLRECRIMTPHESSTYPVLPFVTEHETDRCVTTRMKAVLGEIAARHVGQRVAVITHGGVTRRFLTATFGSSLPAPSQEPHQNTAIHHLQWRAEAWTAERLHDCEHLLSAGLSQAALDAG